MRISDWSSDVCSSDLVAELRYHGTVGVALERDHQGRHLVQLDPAPGVELRVRGRDVDVAVLAQEAQREPALLLATVAAMPDLAAIGRASGRDRVGKYV